MNEQDLRDALRDHTSRIDPEPPRWDGLVRRATAARRRSIAARAGAAGVAAALVVGGLVVASRPEGRSRLRVADDVGTSTTGGPTVPTGREPGPTTTTTGQPPPPTTAAPLIVDAVWPFTTTDELRAYQQSGDRAFHDPVAVARSFARDYVGMRAPVAGEFASTGEGAGTVTVRPSGGASKTTVVALQQAEPGGPWTVTGAAAPTIVVDRPDAASGAVVPSPLKVSGRAWAYEGTVEVEVRADGMKPGEALGKGFVTGAGDMLGPFEGSIAYKRPAAAAGAVLFVEPSADDGAAMAATVVRIRFSAR